MNQLYRVIQSCRTVLRRVLGRSFGADNANNSFSHSPPFPSYDVLTMTSLLLWLFNGGLRTEFVRSQIVEAWTRTVVPVTRTVTTTKCLHLLMRSMQICISCMAFAMEIPLLWSGNVSIDIGIRQNLTDVYLKGCLVIWEKQALMAHALADGVRRVCWTPHTASTRHICSATGRLSRRAARRTVRETKSYPKGLQQGTKTSVYSFVGESYARLHPSISVLLRGAKERFMPRKFGFLTIGLIAFRWLMQTSYVGNWFSSGAQFHVSVRRVFRRGGGHLEQLSSPLASPRHTNRKYSHRSTLEWRLKNVTKIS
jgi:hypothetical protein